MVTGTPRDDGSQQSMWVSVADPDTAFLARLAQASNIETPMAEDLARFERKRKNDVAKMKDGSTHVDHKMKHGLTTIVCKEPKAS